MKEQKNIELHTFICCFACVLVRLFLHVRPFFGYIFSVKFWIKFGKGPGGWDSWDSWDGWDGWDSWDQQINRQLEALSG